MTRADLLSALARRTNKNTTLDTATQNRLVDFLNERNRKILSLPGTEALRRVSLSLTNTTSVARLAFKEVARIHRVYEATNDRYLEPMTLDEYRRQSPDSTSATGTPTHYVWYGLESVARQPPTADKGLYVYSSAAGDTTQTVYVEGTLVRNFPFAASATLAGVTQTLVGTATTWERVNRWYLSAAAAGYVALIHDTSITPYELASIVPGQTETRYSVILLWPTPTDALSYTVDASRHVSNLAQNTDQPDLPEDWHDLVLYGALMDEYQHMNDPRYDIARSEYQERLAQFKYWLAASSAGSGLMAQEPSQLGAWYPAGT